MRARTQVQPRHLGVVEQCLTRSGERNATRFQHRGAMSDSEP